MFTVQAVNLSMIAQHAAAQRETALYIFAATPERGHLAAVELMTGLCKAIEGASRENVRINPTKREAVLLIPEHEARIVVRWGCPGSALDVSRSGINYCEFVFDGAETVTGETLAAVGMRRR